MDATVVQMVPGGSIAGMAISLIISVALPIVLLIVWRKKTGASFSSFCIGAGIFILFALILEQIFHSMMLGLTGTVLRDKIWLYALYGGLAAGLFEETGRFTAMKLLMKTQTGKDFEFNERLVSIVSVIRIDVTDYTAKHRPLPGQEPNQK